MLPSGVVEWLEQDSRMTIKAPLSSFTHCRLHRVLESYQKS